MKIPFDANEYAMSVLTERRNSAALLLEERKETVFTADKRIKDIYSEISEAGILAAMAAATGKAEDASDTIGKLEEQAKEYLAEDGFERDFFENVYTCPICRDTGFTKPNESCICYKKLIATYNAKRISEISPMKMKTFNSFMLDYYSDQPDENYEGAVPRELMKDNLGKIKTFIKNFDTSHGNLLMMGDSGLGKTHLALSIANYLLQRGISANYCQAPSIFKKIETEYYEEHRNQETLAALKNCDLLVLDDLGAEFVSPSMVSVLYDLLDTRFNTGKSTVITTNITDENQLRLRYGEKITSRLLGRCECLPFIGDDIRIKLSSTD